MYNWKQVFPVMAIGFLGVWVWVVLATAGDRKDTMNNSRELTPEEARVILGKGTERPFTGKYLNNHADGTYRCRKCGAPLFRSDAKFDSGSGWPSFDQAIPGAVKEVPDPDGVRVEIECARCDAHLGHVFKGEHFTPKNVRNCVNSISLTFEPAGEGEKSAPSVVANPRASASAGTCASPGEADPSKRVAYFAGGCFWGIEYMFENEPGVLNAVSGYMGGHVENPTYEQVCSHETGHIETVKVSFDPAKTTYEKLARFFFEIHDPTQVDRQGPDVGEQYRSVIFYRNEGQKKIAEELVADLVARGLSVATRIEPAATFWPAEDYHQDYIERTGRACHLHRVDRFGP